MVVDLRTALRGSNVSLPSRTATLAIHPSCVARVVPGGAGGWAEVAKAEAAQATAATAAEVASRHSSGASPELRSTSTSRGASSIDVALAAGGGALLEVSEAGDSSECAASLRRVRRWWLEASALTLRPRDRRQSLPDGERNLHWLHPSSPKDEEFNRFGAARRLSMPGALGGFQSNMLLIGEYDSAENASWASGAEAAEWAAAGFTAATLPAGGLGSEGGRGSGGGASLVAALGWARAVGIFVFPNLGAGAAAAASSVVPADELTKLAAALSCQGVVGGFVLGDGPAAGSAAALGAASDAADAMRQHAYWLMPLMMRVPSVAAAVELSTVGIPLSAVALPSPHSSASPQIWAAALLARMGELVANSSVTEGMTAAVGLDVCALRASDSQLRFAAYASVVWGVQALAWQSMASCAPVGSDAFRLVSSVNARIAQWAEPLFLVPAPGDGPSYRVAALYSTSSLPLPPLQGVAPIAPGSTADAIVQVMAGEMVAVLLQNASAGVTPRRLLLFLSTALDASAGGAAVRDVPVTLHSTVVSSKPIEPDTFQGYATWPGQLGTPGMPPDFAGTGACDLSWLGKTAPLRMPGGSAQLVEFVQQAVPERRVPQQTDGARVGRPPPRVIRESH